MDWLNKNVTPLLAIISVVGGLAILYLFSATKMSPENEKIVLIIIGVLSGLITQVSSYYFGSSNSSSKKDETMGKVLLNGYGKAKPCPPPATPPATP